MKRLIFAIASASLLSCGLANAADMAVKARPLPPAPACAQFGGFYVGANAGWGYGEHRFRDLDGFGPFAGFFLPNEATRSSDGFVGGIQGGYNWQSRCTVFGIEADYNWANVGHDELFAGPLGFATLAASSHLKSFGSIRARTGVVVDNLMLYVTGGLAYAKTERSVDLNIPLLGISEGFSSDKTRLGWTAGFGTEWQFASNWSLKSEVLYARFQTEETAFTCSILCAPARGVRFEHDSSAWVTRIGVNYRFGGGTYGAY